MVGLDPRTRALRSLRWTHRVALGELSEGQRARVVGVARALGETMIAPLSGRECVAFDIRAKAAIGVPRQAIYHATMVEQGGAPFVIEDDSGRVLVDSRDAQIVLALDAEQSAGETSARANAFCERHGVVLSHGRLRYSEGVVEVGAKVAVLGEVLREPDGEATPYRGIPLTRLTSSARAALIVSNYRDTTQ
jgi:hypothetical protein